MAEPEYFWAKLKDLHQIYDPTEPGHDGMDLKIPGIILSVQKQTLQTSSFIADALLARGEALDCSHQKTQVADNMADFIANLSAMQRVNANFISTADNHDIVSQRLAMGLKQIDKMQAEIDVIDQQIGVIIDVATPAEGVGN